MKNSTFSTDHIYLVAYLLCFKHEIVSISRTGKRVAFQFTDTPQLNSNLAGFMSGGTVPARQYAFEVLKLKRMIHNSQYTRVDKHYETAEHANSSNSQKIRQR